MSLKLDNLKGTEWIEYGGECRKIKNWAFISDRYCVKGVDCNSILMVRFENGEKVRVNDIESLNNC